MAFFMCILNIEILKDNKIHCAKPTKLKKIEKIWKKVLTNGEECDILFKHSRRARAKRSLKIEQQIGNESTKRTEKLKKCLVNSKEKNNSYKK